MLSLASHRLLLLLKFIVVPVAAAVAVVVTVIKAATGHISAANLD
jgi:hypothetical protein